MVKWPHFWLKIGLAFSEEKRFRILSPEIADWWLSNHHLNSKFKPPNLEIHGPPTDLHCRPHLDCSFWLGHRQLGQLLHEETAIVKTSVHGGLGALQVPWPWWGAAQSFKFGLQCAQWQSILYKRHIEPLPWCHHEMPYSWQGEVENINHTVLIIYLYIFGTIQKFQSLRKGHQSGTYRELSSPSMASSKSCRSWRLSAVSSRAW